ncbi:MAG: tetratricopeptide repeat protein, partial [Verrucomicrobiota bacterium]
MLLRLDRGEEARTRLEQGLSAHPQAGELWLARGEVAVLEGDAAGARAAFNRALEGSTGAEGWYGLGLVSAEREYVREARQELEEALRRDPGLEKAAAERAAVETFAGNLREADRRYAEVLAKAPSNYVALTGRGINRLKEGEAEGALQDFLRAGLVEPRYARGWMYQGVAFYRLGERYRADQAFGKAGALDAKDPVVHMMASQVAADDLAYGEAIAEARAAQSKMPYLKSLNQLANDQRGSANLGSPLADFGLEAWAKYYADEAYSPYWGGSHLFLSDRYTGTFNKTSELMKGFITDPLAFGASNRFASLSQTPGHYARLDSWYLGEVGFQELGLGATASGLLQSAGAGDAAYFLRGEYRPADSRWNGTTGETDEVVAGLGWKPRHDIGVFAYALDKRVDADIEDSPSPPDGETTFTD